ncbi:MAG: FHA domain-containing protein [Spirochaetales bacterium]|nr:FHA domain-containing protein [Spirochaetales bacterium]
MDETIMSNSKVGKRLKGYKKFDVFSLTFQGKSMPVVSSITVGRDRKNNIQIDDNLTSRRHAVIQKIKDAYFIKDLNSTNGTFVNNKQVPQAKYIKLHRNDVIKIGRTEIIVT